MSKTNEIDHGADLAASLSPRAQAVAALLRPGHAAQKSRLLRESGLEIVALEAALIELEAMGVAHRVGGRVEHGWPASRVSRAKGWPPDPPPQLPTIADFIDLLRRFTEEFRTPKAWQILTLRFGLDGSLPRTFDEIAASLAVKRQAIHQSEAKSLGRLQAFVRGQPFRGGLLSAEWLGALAKLYSTEPWGSLGIRDEVEILNDFGLRSAAEIRQLSFLLEVGGFLRIPSRDLEKNYWALNKNGRDTVLKAALIKRVVVAAGADGLDTYAVAAAVNREGRLKIEPTSVDDLASLASDVERHGQRLRARIDVLPRGDQVARILGDEGQPLRVNEISRRLNKVLALAGQQPIGIETLRNLLSIDDRFEPLGRVGTWILADWRDRYATETIVMLIERELAKAGEPMTADAIYDRIAPRRPLKRNSVPAYLGTRRDLFQHLGGGMWGLRSWGDDSGWSRRRITRWIEDYFVAAKAEILPFTQIRTDFQAASGLNAKSAAKSLEGTNVLSIERKGSVRHAVYLARTARFPRTRRASSNTLRSRVEASVRGTLEEAPPEGVLLHEVLTKLVSETGAPEHTLRNYVAHLPWLEQVQLPGSRYKMCRIRGEEFLRARASQIQDRQRAATVQRALRYLTVESVDVGLFLVAKELEATMREYMHAVGLMPLADKWMLGKMVNEAVKAGLITDNHHVNLLREQRNERGHGPGPSLDERQLLHGKAGFWAGLYMDYIILFERRTVELTGTRHISSVV